MQPARSIGQRRAHCSVAVQIEQQPEDVPAVTRSLVDPTGHGPVFDRMQLHRDEGCRSREPRRHALVGLLARNHICQRRRLECPRGLATNSASISGTPSRSPISRSPTSRSSIFVPSRNTRCSVATSRTAPESALSTSTADGLVPSWTTVSTSVVARCAVPRRTATATPPTIAYRPTGSAARSRVDDRHGAPSRPPQDGRGGRRWLSPDRRHRCSHDHVERVILRTLRARSCARSRVAGRTASTGAAGQPASTSPSCISIITGIVVQLRVRLNELVRPSASGVDIAW